MNLSRRFLEEAAPDYLSDEEYDFLDDDWLTTAFAETSTPVHGNLAPLRPVRPRPTPGLPAVGPPTSGARESWPSPARPQPETGPCYRLADYLEQQARRHRSLLCPLIHSGWPRTPTWTEPTNS
ncbi:hypothetical protein O3Q52_45350 [Streptomyces sp. ActVer]|uniref:hypothetical protein n=1 Tax=Streptomyces sp. ActVer TaxID=3014558 RepID=UPI0022B38FEB|nr:hypothetical protein [Streptomyces sp. ActVer]MCZ4515223.1 hypothetical protein [Streptomyces sp. ActVer]